MITILKNDEEHDRQTVQLSLDISGYGTNTKLTLAHFGKSYINLARLTEAVYRDENGNLEDREHIALTEQEADALVEAWPAFKAGIAAREQAEVEKREQMKREAFKLVESVKTDVAALDIQVTEDTSHRWFTVEVPAFSFYQSAYQIEELLDTVKSAISRIEHKIANLENETEDYQHRYYSEAGLAVRASQIAAWRKVRPVGGDDRTPEQGAEVGDPLSSDERYSEFLRGEGLTL